MNEMPLSDGNRRLIEMVDARRKLKRDSPESIFPWWGPCQVRVLLVADGVLDFGLGDFGLSAFVSALVDDRRSYVRFALTLAHRADGDLGTAAGIERRVSQFRFDDADHFQPGGFEEVWLFGFEHSPGMSPSEIAKVSEHMSAGGGVFATGDHGDLGRALCGSLPRVRSMRHWDDIGNPSEVSMSGRRRNDSNQTGRDAGSQFSDQSDDIPQPLELKTYRTPSGWSHEARYPHPVMCSRYGPIEVFPDHPHEGECRVPADLTHQYLGADEFPMALDGSGRVAPELVASGFVHAGQRAIVDGKPTKEPTEAHEYGVVSTYDGHRAGVGRVVCDSTWHHFVNINLIGIDEFGQNNDFPDDPHGSAGTPGTSWTKHSGFLSTSAGRAALDKIREYYVNVGVWIAPSASHECFRNRLLFDIVWEGRVVEAAITTLSRAGSDVPVSTLRSIGIHARDVIGRKAGACQTIASLLPELPDQDLIAPFIDPWAFRTAGGDGSETSLSFVDLEPLFDCAVGAGVLEMWRVLPRPHGDVGEIAEAARDAFRRGARDGLVRAAAQLGDELDSMRGLAVQLAERAASGS